jgi:ABC-type ATPase with predicted acetyltransferase domain
VGGWAAGRVTGRAGASERLLRALASFGLLVGEVTGAPSPGFDGSVVGRVLGLGPGAVVLCTGPSGCGKSTLLRAVGDAARARGTTVIDASALLRAAAPERPVIDLVPLPVERAMRVLAGAGLGEATLWARLPSELSEGQRARLGLALAMAGVGVGVGGGVGGCRPSLVVLDEFCSTLDRVTARCVAHTLRRWAGASPCVVVCATAHEDLLADLAPDLHVRPLAPEGTP